MTRVVTLTVCLVLLCPLTTQRVWADAASAGAQPAPSIDFNLPSQALAQALHAYGQRAELAIMAQTELLDGRTSSVVEGRYSARDALQQLLAGTGLQAIFTSANEVIIRPVPPAQQAAAPAEPPPQIFASNIDGALDGNDYATYNAMVQTRLTQALCESAQTHPGSYRLVVQLRIGNSGAVVASKMVGSTGLPARDTAIERAIQKLLFDSAPPAGLQQPVTILLRPLGNGVDTSCAQFDTQGS